MGKEPVFRGMNVFGPVIVGGAYLCAASFAIVMTRNTDGLGTIWPASGIMLAAVLAVPGRRVPAYLLAGGIASLLVNLLAMETVWTAIALTIANVAEGAAARAVFRLRITVAPDMTRPAHVRQLCIAALLAALTSASLATVLSGTLSLTFFVSWLVTATLGMLVMTPVALTGWSLLRRDDRVRIGRGPMEATGLLLMLTAVSIAVFAQNAFPLLFVPMLMQMAVTYRLGPFGAAAGVLIVATTMTVFTATGMGPLLMIRHSMTTVVLFSQLYLLALLASALPLATLLAKHEALMRELRTAYDEAARTAAAAVAAADTDQLTGVASRRRVLGDLAQALDAGRRTGTAVSIALLDIDHFKQVNDGFGHAMGDLVLRGVANAIRVAVRGDDHIGRVGGEEFLIVFRGTDTLTALTIAERIRCAIEAAALTGPGTPPVTASIGVATASAADSLEALIEHADRALYLAKGGGRNRTLLAA